MKYTLVPSFLLLFCLDSYACDCVPNKDYETAKDLEEYEYIALVKIDSTFLSDHQKADNYFYESSISTLIQFKGNQHDRLIVNGGLYGLTDWMTSCDLGVSVGETWLIFSTITEYQKPIVFACEYTSMYANRLGIKKWFHNSSEDEIAKLKSIFHIRDSTQIDGERKTYYPDGSLERVESYKSGRLEGSRIVYYPEGDILLSESYSNGHLEGKQYWYKPDSILYREWNFKKGLPFDTCYYYFKSGQIHYERIFNENGKMTQDTQYYLNGTIRILSMQDNVMRTYEETAYYPSGQVHYRNKDFLDDFKKIYSEEFYENGQMSRQWDYQINSDSISHYFKAWDEAGQLIKSRVYFGPRDYKELTIKH